MQTILKRQEKLKNLLQSQTQIKLSYKIKAITGLQTLQ